MGRLYTPKPPKGGFNSQLTIVLKPPLGGLGVNLPPQILQSYFIVVLTMVYCEIKHLPHGHLTE